jgi:glycosyltransferase involved in cell wall biosynthesis
MSKIKVLETIRQGNVGGKETYLFNLVTRLDPDRFETEVLCFSDGELITALNNYGIKTHVIKTETPFDIRVFPHVKQLIAERNFDLVHFHGTRAGTNTMIPAWLTDRKAIYTVHGWSFHVGTSEAVRRGKILAESFLVKMATTVVCGSESDLNTGLRECGGREYRLIRNSIDVKQFDPSASYANIREQLHIPDTATVVTFMARLSTQKDPLTFLKAIPFVLQKHPGTKFCLFGDGNLREAVAEMIHQIQAGDCITFGTFRKDVAAVLNLTDIYVLPSLWEVIPLGLLEAMAMGKACIATDIPGTTEALHDNKNGLLFPAGDAEALAEGINRLIEDKDLSRRLGAEARKTVLEHFNIETLIRENESLYEEIAPKAE